MNLSSASLHVWTANIIENTWGNQRTIMKPPMQPSVQEQAEVVLHWAISRITALDLSLLLPLLAGLLQHSRPPLPLWQVLYTPSRLWTEGQGLPVCFSDITEVSWEWCELSVTNSFSTAAGSSAQVNAICYLFSSSPCFKNFVCTQQNCIFFFTVSFKFFAIFWKLNNDFKKKCRVSK